MKKILLSIILSLNLYAEQVIEINTIEHLRTQLPGMYEVAKDFLTAKKCNNTFNENDLNDVKEFLSHSPSFGTLIALKTLELNDIYNNLIHNYKAMNCNKQLDLKIFESFQKTTKELKKNINE